MWPFKKMKIGPGLGSDEEVNRTLEPPDTITFTRIALEQLLPDPRELDDAAQRVRCGDMITQDARNASADYLMQTAEKMRTLRRLINQRPRG